MCSAVTYSDSTACPGCGVRVANLDTDLDADFNATRACRNLCFEVSSHTLVMRDRYFIHQLVVDAYAAQHTGPRVKPIATAFALIGLYLVWERGYSGKQVQNAHMHLGRRWKEWPRFPEPSARAKLTVQDVARAPGSLKEAAIKDWSQAVWDTWKGEVSTVAKLFDERMGFR